MAETTHPNGAPTPMEQSAEVTTQQMAPAPAAEPDLDLFGYVRIILSYWWIMAPLAVLGGALGLLYCYYAPPVYRATCRFEIFMNEVLNVGETTDQPTSRRWTYNPLERHRILLESENLNERISDPLNERWDYEPSDSSLPGVELVVEPVKGAQEFMLDVRVDSFHGQYSLEYINALFEGYHQLRLDELSQVHASALQQLRAEQRKLRDELEKARAAIVEFETAHDLMFAEKKHQSDIAHLANILAKERAIRTQRTVLESQFPFIDDANAAILRDVLDLTMFTTGEFADQAAGATDAPGFSDVNQWRDNEAEVKRLEAEYKYLSDKYKPGHPKMIELQEQIDKAKLELDIAAELTLKRLIARRDALRMQESALADTAKNVRTLLDLSAAQRAEYDHMKARVEHIRNMHDKVFSRMIDSAATPKDRYFFQIIEGPEIVSSPVWPIKWQMVALGTFAGAGLGALFAVLIALRRMRMYNFDWLRQQLGLECIASIPKVNVAGMKKNALFLNDQSRSAVVCEVYRTLRTGIERAMGENGRLVLLTSPDPGEGKTFTSLNLACAFSWSKGKVLVVDGDFRRTKLTKELGGSDSQGLIDCLTDDELKWKDCVQQDIAPNLDYLPAGASSEHAAELIEAGRLEAIFQELRDEYDMVVVDSAPVNRVVDTMLMARYADGVVIIALAGKTSTHAVEYGMRRLGFANVLGYVHNRVTSATEKYYNSHYYYYPGNSYYQGYSSYKSYDKYY